MVKDNLGGHREGKKILIPPWPGPTTPFPGQLSVCLWVPQVFSRPLSQRTPFLLKLQIVELLCLWGWAQGSQLLRVPLTRT